MNSPENRKSTRFKGEIPIELNQGKGLTRDFSTEGIFFITDAPLAAGAPIEFIMFMDHSGLGPGMRLRCRGEVVRVEKVGERKGVAACISAFWSAA